MTEYKGLIPEREPEKRLQHPRKAAGAQITHSLLGEVVVTKNNNWNGYILNEYPLDGKSGASSRGNSKVSIKLVAVDKFVV